eukprot:UN20861
MEFEVVDGDFYQTLSTVGLEDFCDKMFDLRMWMRMWSDLTEKDLSGIGIERNFLKRWKTIMRP